MLTGYEKVPASLQQYVDYIKNTGQVPLAVTAFDDDFEPVGPILRERLQKGGFIYDADDDGIAILLRPDLADSRAR